MKFLKSLPREKLQRVLLAAIGSLIGLAAIGNFYVATNWSSFSQQRTRAAKLSADYDTALAAQKQEVANTVVRDQMKDFVDAQQQRMIAGDPFSWVVREVMLVAEQHPVRVSAMRPGAKINNSVKSRYEMFVTRIEVEGGYDHTAKFLRDLENSFPTGEIRSLEVAGADAKRTDCRVVFEFALLMKPVEPPAATKNKKVTS